LIENYQCKSKRELRKREQYWINKLKNICINKKGACGYNTFKEYYDNDLDFRERHKNYMLQPVKCICGCTVLRNHMSRHKKTKKHIEYNAKIRNAGQPLRK